MENKIKMLEYASTKKQRNKERKEKRMWAKAGRNQLSNRSIAKSKSRMMITATIPSSSFA
jgi:hypothetical protein